MGWSFSYFSTLTCSVFLCYTGSWVFPEESAETRHKYYIRCQNAAWCIFSTFGALRKSWVSEKSKAGNRDKSNMWAVMLRCIRCEREWSLPTPLKLTDNTNKIKKNNMWFLWGVTSSNYCSRRQRAVSLVITVRLSGNRHTLNMVPGDVPFC